MRAPGPAGRASGRAVRRRARDRQADLHGLGPPRPALDRRELRLPQRQTERADAVGRDRIKICEDTDGDGRADKFTIFAEGLSIPTSMCFAVGRPDRPAGPRHAVPAGHRRRRQGRRPQGPVHRLGHQRHPRRAEQPAVGPRQLDLRDRRLFRVRRHGRRRAAPVPPGHLPVQARRLEAGVPPQHEQQLVGPGLQRGGPGRSARPPTAARASSWRSRTATTSRSAAGRRASCSMIADHERVLSR